MNHPKAERALVIIKPDGVQRTLIGEIIGRFEKLGLKLVAMKMCVPTEELVDYRLIQEQILYDVNLDGILE